MFHILQHVPPAHFGSPDTGSGALGVIRSWCKLVGVKAGRCKSCLVQKLVGAKASGVKADL